MPDKRRAGFELRATFDAAPTRGDGTAQRTRTPTPPHPSAASTRPATSTAPTRRGDGTAQRTRTPKPPQPGAASTPTTTSIGRGGEQVAATYLERHGYRVVGRNVRAGRGEIDIVAFDGEILCFVEVRLRERLEDALASVHGKKQMFLVRAARHYLAKNYGTPPFCRFDVVVVAGNEIQLIKNAFEAPPP